MRDKQIEERRDISNIIYWSGYGFDRGTCNDISKQIQEQGYRKASDIFEEIESILSSDEIDEGLKYDEYWGASVAISRIDNKLAELKKKYLGEDINAPTIESEGEG